MNVRICASTCVLCPRVHILIQRSRARRSFLFAAPGISKSPYQKLGKQECTVGTCIKTIIYDSCLCTNNQHLLQSFMHKNNHLLQLLDVHLRVAAISLPITTTQQLVIKSSPSRSHRSFRDSRLKS